MVGGPGDEGSSPPAPASAPGAERSPRGAVWGLAAAAIVLLGSIGVPLLRPDTVEWAVRATTVLSLVCGLAALGLRLRMGGRAFPAATLAVLLIYGATAWIGPLRPLVPIGDLFILTILTSFAFFALAGVLLVFVVEEIVFDLHRVVAARQGVGAAAPLFMFLLLDLLLPIIPAWGGPRLPAALAVSLIATAFLFLLWMARLAWPLPSLVQREANLLAYGVLLAAALTDGARYLDDVASAVPSVIALLVLVGTWLYVSYTTIHRAHLLLGGRHRLPWLAVMLAGSAAMVSHTWHFYDAAGTAAVTSLASQRTAYLVAGVWLGIAWVSIRALRRLVVAVRDERGMGRTGRTVAARLARLAEWALSFHLIDRIVGGVLRAMDRLLPGKRQPPERDSLEAEGSAAAAETRR
ncbi:MAG: hypothetical protein ACPGQL_05920 [Thermoplasmatota archaeon]